MGSYSSFTIVFYPTDPFVKIIKELLNLRIKYARVLLKVTVLELMKKWLKK